MPTIVISEDTYSRLQKLAEPLRDTADSVVRRLLDERDRRAGSPTGTEPSTRSTDKAERHARSEDFHRPILETLDLGPAIGLRPKEVKAKLDKRLGSTLSDWDRQKEPSGMVRWEHRVYAAKEDLKQWGLVIKVNSHWQVTEQGRLALRNGTI